MATSRQKIAIDKWVEKGGRTTVADVMREAEYDATTIKNPKHLTESKAWKQMLEDQLPDSMLVEKMIQGLDATKPIGASILVDKNGRVVKAEEQGVIEVADYATQHKYLDTALKVKNKYPQPNQFNQFNIGDMKLSFVGTNEDGVEKTGQNEATEEKTTSQDAL